MHTSSPLVFFYIASSYQKKEIKFFSVHIIKIGRDIHLRGRKNDQFFCIYMVMFVFNLNWNLVANCFQSSTWDLHNGYDDGQSFWQLFFKKQLTFFNTKKSFSSSSLPFLKTGAENEEITGLLLPWVIPPLSVSKRPHTSNEVKQTLCGWMRVYRLETGWCSILWLGGSLFHFWQLTDFMVLSNSRALPSTPSPAPHFINVVISKHVYKCSPPHQWLSNCCHIRNTDKAV